MAFKHGISNVDVPTAGGTISINPSSVIGLVSVSPVGPVNTLTLCNNSKDDEQFGEDTPNNYLAKTLRLIRSVVAGASKSPSDGSCPIVVVNVYDVANHKVSLSSTGVAIDSETGKASLNCTIIGDLASVAITRTTGGSNVNVAAGGSYVYGTDYTLDRYGNFKDITGTYKGISGGLSFSGYKLSTAAVVASDIIGGTSGSTKTGIALLDRTEGTWGIKPKLLLCPGFNTLSGVAAALETAAGKFRGEYLSDSASGVTLSSALALRGSGLWATSKPQTRPVWPWLKSYDKWTNADTIYPYSAYLAGMYVANDNNTGFWDSVSNQQIPTVTGVEREISCDFEDSNSEANQLNAAGIMTYMTGYGLGYKTWGNRNASYPTDNSVKTFSNVYRTDGMISDSMTKAALKYVDKGITKANIDIVKTEGNNFIATLIQKGACLPGSEILYKKEDNSASELAAGKIKFRRVYMITTPMEDITFYNELDINLFNNVIK